MSRQQLPDKVRSPDAVLAISQSRLIQFVGDSRERRTPVPQSPNLGQHSALLGIRHERTTVAAERHAKRNAPNPLTPLLRFAHGRSRSRANQTAFEFANCIENPTREYGARIVVLCTFTGCAD